MLNVSEESIHHWIHNGTLPCYRVRDKYRLNRVELLEWATARKMTVAPEYFHANGTKPPDLLLTNALRRGGVIPDLPCTDKPSALQAICQTMPLPEAVDRDELFSVLVAREALCSTGMGNGVAIPHPRGPIVLGISEPQVTLVFPRQPFDYGALDGKPVSILFVIVRTTVRVHLQLLSHLMFALQDDSFRHLLNERATQNEILLKLGTIEAHLMGIESGRGAQ